MNKNYGLILILIFLQALPAYCQEISEIVVWNQQADEPPTKRGQRLYQIRFKKNSAQVFESKEYFQDKKKVKLKENIILDKIRVDSLSAWMESNRKVFQLSDFNLSPLAIQSQIKNSLLELNFPIPDPLLIDTDSFAFCQEFKLTRRISIGGFEIGVKFIFPNQERVFIFRNDDFGRARLQLGEYLFCYQLLASKLPEAFPNDDFFEAEACINKITLYQKTVECEGYYYEKFKAENPDRTKQENRMRKGWDFQKYLNDQ